MVNTKGRAIIAAVFVLAIASAARVSAAGSEPAESKRLAQAKDLIAEEQWTRAIEVLRAAVADPKERGRDESTYWLAHSLSHAGDPAGALETIRRLEREFPASLWVKPARALRVEMAVRLGRNDVLWWTAVPAPPRPAAVVPPPHPPTSRAERQARGVAPPPTPPVPPDVPSPPRPGSVWIPEGFHPDVDLRVQALGHLIRSDARVIPVLREIAFEGDNLGPASRALFVLAQSGKPEAQATVVDVAKTGPEPLRIAAVRELGRFGGPEVSKELLTVYSVGDLAVKRQVVNALGERSDQPALLTIVRSEQDSDLLGHAMLMLAAAGATDQLRVSYDNAGPRLKRSILLGLFNARAERDLIQIAERERDPELRKLTLGYLRTLGTPQAKEYLQKTGRNR